MAAKVNNMVSNNNKNNERNHRRKKQKLVFVKQKKKWLTKLNDNKYKVEHIAKSQIYGVAHKKEDEEESISYVKKNGIQNL